MRKFLLFSLFIAALVVYAANAQAKLADTLDELDKIHPPAETCKTCHADIYEQWTKSVHAESVLHSLVGINAFITAGIGKEEDRKARASQPGGLKAEMMKCFTCHAPQLEDASDKLIKEIVDAITAVASKKDESAKAKLARVRVTCTGCHNIKALHPPAKAEKNVMYGVKGTGQSPYHKIQKTAFLNNPNFCMQCHGVSVAPDGEPIMCNTLSQSYRDHYVAMGGLETCQDCHMRKKNRGHTFPGAYALDTLREGIDLNVVVRKVSDLNVYEPKPDWKPAAVITVDITNRAGHRIPDG
jgi:hypothetical protein